MSGPRRSATKLRGLPAAAARRRDDSRPTIGAQIPVRPRHDFQSRHPTRSRPDLRSSRHGPRRRVALGGGGAIGVVLLLAYVLLGGNPNDLGPVLQPGAVTNPESSALATDCKTGQDANERDDCRILGYVNSIQAYWTSAFSSSGNAYQPSDTVLFSGATNSGCGAASAATGPFYCPLDALVYLDLDFFRALRDKLRRAGWLARPGLRPRPRVRPSRPGPARAPVRVGRRRRRDRPVGPDGAPGRLLRGRLGEPRDQHRLPRGRSPMPRSPMPSMPRRPSATTGSRRRPRARWTPTRGRTARPSSARSGS